VEHGNLDVIFEFLLQFILGKLILQNDASEANFIILEKLKLLTSTQISNASKLKILAHSQCKSIKQDLGTKFWA
jgi:hypothetical protein